MGLQRHLTATAVVLLPFALMSTADAACCYFSAKNADVLQPGQKVFITWDPVKQTETFTVQPKFEGNAPDFGMVIPTPAQPKLHEMPRDFFKNMAVYSILMQREFPRSKLVPTLGIRAMKGGGFGGAKGDGKGGGGFDQEDKPKPPTIVILEEGVVGSLDYKIISADRADDLYKWLKDHKYQYAGDEATLNHYVKKKWVFTVMKIDTVQMKQEKNGNYSGDVTPTRFQFSSTALIYPLRITQISVRDKTEALFYVQAPYKVDLLGDMSYQNTWVPMLQSSTKPGKLMIANLPGRGSEWLAQIDNLIPDLLQRNKELGFVFVRNQRPRPNVQGHTPTTMEWARKLTDQDIGILIGAIPYCETVPDVDQGLTEKDLNNDRQAVISIINGRLTRARADHPNGYLVRYVPEADIKALRQLADYLRSGLWITKFRKIFARDEMNDDLLIGPARLGNKDDFSEYTEILPTSPP
jgi:hypothetical protein